MRHIPIDGEGTPLARRESNNIGILQVGPDTEAPSQSRVDHQSRLADLVRLLARIAAREFVDSETESWERDRSKK